MFALTGGEPIIISGISIELNEKISANTNLFTGSPTFFLPLHLINTRTTCTRSSAASTPAGIAPHFIQAYFSLTPL